MKYAIPHVVALLLAIAGFALHAYFLVPLAILVVVMAALVQYAIPSTRQRAEYIRGYAFPDGLFDKLAQRRPELKADDIPLVARGLRQFFLAHLSSGRKFVSMPSQVVDDLWHEFILYTKHYEDFCKQAFGAFFHHSPAAVLSAAQSGSNVGLRRCWWFACRQEKIDPRQPAQLPLLFALDSQLKIAGGFIYAANCEALRASGIGDVYCGGDFSNSSFDGSTAGFGDAGGGDGHSHGDGGDGGGHGGGDGGAGGDGGGGGGDGGSSCGGGGCGGGGGD